MAFKHLAQSDSSSGQALSIETRPSSSLTIKEWLTTGEAADYLGLPVGSLRNMTSNGQVPYHKLGRRNRYLSSDLRTLLLKEKRGGSK